MMGANSYIVVIEECARGAPLVSEVPVSFTSIMKAVNASSINQFTSLEAKSALPRMITHALQPLKSTT